MADIIKLQGSADFDAVVSALQSLERQLEGLADLIAREQSLGVDTDKAEAELRAAAQAAKDLGAAVDSAGAQAEAALSGAAGDAGQLEGALEGAGEGGLDLGNILETALGNVGALAIQRVTELARAFVSALAESTELIQQLRDRAEDLGAAPEEAAARVNQLNQAASDLGTTLGDVGAAALEGQRKLQGLGVGAGESASTIDRLLRVAVSARGEVDDFGDIVEALGQSFEAGGINLKSFIDELERRVPGAADIAAQKLGVTRESLNDIGVVSEEVARELLPELAAALEGAFGDKINDQIEDSRESMAGVQARLTEIVNQVGGELIPAVERLARTLNDALDSETGEATVVVLTKISQLVVEILNIAGKLLIAVDLAFLGISQLITFTLEGIAKIAKAIPGLGDLAQDLDDALDDVQSNLERRNREALRALVDFGQGLEDAGDAAGDAGDKIDDFSEAFGRAAAAAEEAAERVQAATADTVEAEREAARERLAEAEKLAENLSEAERKVAEERIAAIRESVDAATDAERELVDARAKAAEEAVEAVREAEGELREIRAEAAEEAIKAAEDAAERLQGVERENAEVRVRIISKALDEILEKEKEAGDKREELIEKQRDALDKLADGFRDLAEVIEETGDVDFGGEEAVENVGNLQSELSALEAELEALQGKDIISVDESNRITELSSTLIPELRSRIRELGESGKSDLQPLNESIFAIGDQFRATIADMLSEGGALSELFGTLSQDGRDSLQNIITEFVSTAEQVGLTGGEVETFIKLLAGRLASEGVEVPRELAEAFGDAGADIGTSTLDIADRLRELDAKARETAEAGKEGAAGIGEIGDKASEAKEPLEAAALSITKTADGIIRITQARRESGNPLEGLVDPVAGENAEPLQAAADNLERIGDTVAGLGETGTPAAESIQAIFAAMLEAAENGSVEDVATQIERLGEVAPKLAEDLAKVAEPVAQISETAADAAEGVESFASALDAVDVDDDVEKLEGLGTAIEDVGEKAGDAEGPVVDLDQALDDAGGAAEDLSEGAGRLDTSLGELDEALGDTVEQLGDLNDELDPKKINDAAAAVDTLTESVNNLASAAANAASELAKAREEAEGLAAAAAQAGVDG